MITSVNLEYCKISRGPQNNLSTILGPRVGVPNIFVRLMGKNVHVEEVGRWSKKGKIMFMELLNDPQPKSS